MGIIVFTSARSEHTINNASKYADTICAANDFDGETISKFREFDWEATTSQSNSRYYKIAGDGAKIGHVS